MPNAGFWVPDRRCGSPIFRHQAFCRYAFTMHTRFIATDSQNRTFVPDSGVILFTLRHGERERGRTRKGANGRAMRRRARCADGKRRGRPGCPSRPRNDALSYASARRTYFATMFTRRPGTTTTFLTSLPASAASTAARPAAFTSSSAASAATMIFAFTLPFT